MTPETFDVWRCPFKGLFTDAHAIAQFAAQDGVVVLEQTTCGDCNCIDGAEGPFTAILVDAPTSGRNGDGA